MTGNDEIAHGPIALGPIALGPCGNRRLTAEQWDQFKHSARQARTQAMHDLVGAVLRSLHERIARGRGLIRTTAAWVTVAAGSAWRSYAAWRKRRAAIRELRALDDRMLKDIGLGRSEIESAIRDPERLLARGPATTRGHPRVVCAGVPARAQKSTVLIDRSAA
jgi:uncharacterized protein YjiS (DUF1127 family)